MKNYLVYTLVTAWDEPPRARHQVANELKAEGKVYFVERNKVGKPRVEIKTLENNLVLITPYFPIVYKARYRTPGLNEIYHHWLLKKLKAMNLDFEMVFCFDYTAHVIDQYYDNVVFYCADDNVGRGNFNPFFINQYHAKTERLVASKARICVCTSDYMGKKIGQYNSNTHVVPLGAPLINYDKIASPKKDKELPTLAVVGFLDQNMDYNLLCEIVSQFKTIFIGPVSDANKQCLAKYANAVFVGQKTGRELYDALSEVDVCIAPYDVTQLNKGATPNKLWLYLALGKPAVVTNMPNIESWEFGDKLVYKCENKDFIANCIKAYNDDTAELAAKRVELARNNTWKHRIEKIKQIFYSIQNNALNNAEVRELKPGLSMAKISTQSHDGLVNTIEDFA